jgi:Protein of unknown function (DUF3105)
VAKKSRTPPPPRRVQAPQKRHGKHGRDPDQRRRLLLALFAVSGLVALGIVIAVIVFTGGSSSSSTSSTASLEGSQKVAAAMRSAGCTYLDKAGPKPPKGSAQHIATLADKVDWNTYPPAAGQHYPEWAVWGFYRDPVNPKQVVHNEEHGGAVLWWGPQTPAATVDKLQAFYQESPNSMFGTPIGTLNGKSLGSKVAFTAWTGSPETYQRANWGFEHVAVCPTFDESAFKVFRDAYRGKGPEGIPTSANNPGEGP